MAIETIITHNGKRYSGVLAEIKSTSLGVNDHGIFSSSLNVEGPGWGTSVGGFALDQYDGKGKRCAYPAGDWIGSILTTVGVDDWEDLVGCHVYVLYTEGSSGLGQIARGIAELHGERVMVFKEYWEDYKAENAEIFEIMAARTAAAKAAR